MRLVVPGFNEGGASTLATQIEKFRHSPSGLTGGVGEKLRQMLTASAHVYINGPNTTKRREEIVTTYLNSTPLSSFPGYGEVIGLPDALYVWFGTDFNQAMQVLNSTPKTKGEWARKGETHPRVSSPVAAYRASAISIAMRTAVAIPSSMPSSTRSTCATSASCATSPIITPLRAASMPSGCSRRRTRRSATLICGASPMPMASVSCGPITRISTGWIQTRLWTY